MNTAVRGLLLLLLLSAWSIKGLLPRGQLFRPKGLSKGKFGSRYTRLKAKSRLGWMMFPVSIPLLPWLPALWAVWLDHLGWMDGTETGSAAHEMNLRICKRADITWQDFAVFHLARRQLETKMWGVFCLWVNSGTIGVKYKCTEYLKNVWYYRLRDLAS